MQLLIALRRTIAQELGSIRATEYDVHPEYPTLRDNIPLTYALTMKACLRQHAMERPTFDQILELLDDVSAEVRRGKYLDGDGRARVRSYFFRVQSSARSTLIQPDSYVRQTTHKVTMT